MFMLLSPVLGRDAGSLHGYNAPYNPCAVDIIWWILSLNEFECLLLRPDTVYTKVKLLNSQIQYSFISLVWKMFSFYVVKKGEGLIRNPVKESV